MTTLTIQVGQCGNQLGASLFDTLYLNTKDIKRDAFFDAHDRARAVLVDMEPKVIDRCLSRTSGSSWTYDRYSAFSMQSGAGNNWAFGFNHFGPRIKQDVSDRIRRQMEMSDRTDAVVILKSTAGGTGSGVGAYIQQMLGGKLPIMTVELWPFVQGEVCVQTYNTALSLAAGQEFSDLVVAFENSVMQEFARTRLGIVRPTFHDINAIVANHIAHQLIPSATGSTSSVISHLSCMPDFKLATARFLPQSTAVQFQTDEWCGLVQGLGGMLNSGRVIDFDRGRSPLSNKVLTANICLRGDFASALDLKPLLSNKPLFSSRAVDPVRVISDKSTRFQGYQKSCSAIAVDQHPVHMLQVMAAKAQVMLNKNAYVHLYEKHQISKQDLCEAVVSMHETVDRYRNL